MLKRCIEMKAPDNAQIFRSIAIAIAFLCMSSHREDDSLVFASKTLVKIYHASANINSYLYRLWLSALSAATHPPECLFGVHSALYCYRFHDSSCWKGVLAELSSFALRRFKVCNQVFAVDPGWILYYISQYLMSNDIQKCIFIFAIASNL